MINTMFNIALTITSIAALSVIAGLIAGRLQHAGVSWGYALFAMAWVTWAAICWIAWIIMWSLGWT